MDDEVVETERAAPDRRRFLRACGLAGLALASAPLLAACPVQAQEDDGEESEDEGGDD